MKVLICSFHGSSSSSDKASGIIKFDVKSFYIKLNNSDILFSVY